MRRPVELSSNLARLPTLDGLTPRHRSADTGSAMGDNDLQSDHSRGAVDCRTNAIPGPVPEPSDVVQRIAHDLNNLLTVVHSSVQVGYHSAEEWQRCLEPVGIAILQATELVALLRHRTDLPQPFRTVDLSTLAHNLEPLLRCVLGPSRVLVLKTPCPAKAMGSRLELARILVNLVSNARDATSETGIVTVFTDVVQSHPSSAETRSTACVGVHDDGCGFSVEALDRLFEPGFTTKGAAGSGLGLSAARQTVESYGGRIVVESRPHGGTKVVLALPEAVY